MYKNQYTFMYNTHTHTHAHTCVCVHIFLYSMCIYISIYINKLGEGLSNLSNLRMRNISFSHTTS